VVSVRGEVDLATAPALERTLLGVTEDRTGEVIVDLGGCRFLDSRGLGVLVAARRRLERSNRRLALVLANPTVLRIFQITGFDELFEIYPSLGAAVDRDGNCTATAIGSWRERESETQARSREENESTARARGSPAADRGALLSLRVWRLARNHENSESEELIDEHERFAVVEKVSREAAKRARRSYLRHGGKFDEDPGGPT
jgi:anti-sigma B factor antagonist